MDDWDDITDEMVERGVRAINREKTDKEYAHYKERDLGHSVLKGEIRIVLQAALNPSTNEVTE